MPLRGWLHMNAIETRERHLFSGTSLPAQVAVLGAGGGIGQPLSLLLKVRGAV